MACAFLALGYSHDGRRLGAGGEEGRLFLLDPQGGVQRSFPTFQTRITALALAPRQDLIATAGADGSLKLWDASGRPVIVEEEALGHRLYGLDFDPLSNTLMAAGDHGRWLQLRIRDLNKLLQEGCHWLEASLQCDRALHDLKKTCASL
ncbi:MAG: WD40 repeat domain-containing protein [Cyanobacteriota bacterium]|nr:WD40 repeat domain-containing protein [Cyanobacteriota bacterium]